VFVFIIVPVSATKDSGFLAVGLLPDERKREIKK
jgi:hypothetical protein